MLHRLLKSSSISAISIRRISNLRSCGSINNFFPSHLQHRHFNSTVAVTQPDSVNSNSKELIRNDKGPNMNGPGSSENSLPVDIEQEKSVTIRKLDLKISPHKLLELCRMVRGLSVEEAMIQCKMALSPKAMMVSSAIFNAKNAAKGKGMDVKRLYVALAWASKAKYEKRIDIKGRSKHGIRFLYRSHLHVVVREQPRPAGVEAGQEGSSASFDLSNLPYPLLRAALDRQGKERKIGRFGRTFSNLKYTMDTFNKNKQIAKENNIDDLVERVSLAKDKLRNSIEKLEERVSQRKHFLKLRRLKRFGLALGPRLDAFAKLDYRKKRQEKGNWAQRWDRVPYDVDKKGFPIDRQVDKNFYPRPTQSFEQKQRYERERRRVEEADEAVLNANVLPTSGQTPSNAPKSS